MAIIGKEWERNVHEVQRKGERKLWAASDVYLKSRLCQEKASGDGNTLKVYNIMGVGHEVAIKTASVYNCS